MPETIDSKVNTILKLIGEFGEALEKYKEAGEIKINDLSFSVSKLMPLFISIIIVYIIYLNNMPVDIELQKRIIKYIVWGLPQFIFWSILFINFLFWLFR